MHSISDAVTYNSLNTPSVTVACTAPINEMAQQSSPITVLLTNHITTAKTTQCL